MKQAVAKKRVSDGSILRLLRRLEWGEYILAQDRKYKGLYPLGLHCGCCGAHKDSEHERRCVLGKAIKELRLRVKEEGKK